MVFDVFANFITRKLPIELGNLSSNIVSTNVKRKLHNFEKLQAWQTAARIDKSIYSLTKTFPNKEQFILISQIQRASISICSNIAEGSGRRIGKE